MSPLVSIIVPSYKESANITPLCTRLFASFPSTAIEIIIVDDNSQDGLLLPSLVPLYLFLLLLIQPRCRNGGCSECFG